mmetsp:Transcript_27651/g.60883  ORF Transcript_27651/g.60883 Transcript_27651/m.60883 type:complete len:1026 (+) Transcript_27651:78-3155(+)
MFALVGLRAHVRVSAPIRVCTARCYQSNWRVLAPKDARGVRYFAASSGEGSSSSSGSDAGGLLSSDKPGGSAGAESSDSSFTPAHPSGTPPRSSGSTAKPKALFALPLYRKPCFPGFFHIVQVADPFIMDFLTSLRKAGQAEYLAGLITVDPPNDSEQDSTEPQITIPPEVRQSTSAVLDNSTAEGSSNSSGEGAKRVRKDTGRVSCASELESFGTLLQVVSINPHVGLSGGQVVVMAKGRIKLKKALSSPTPATPLCAVFVENIPALEPPQDDEDFRAIHAEIVATMKDLLKTEFPHKQTFEQVVKYYNLDDPVKIADMVAGLSMAPREELQAVLIEDRPKERLRKVLMLIKKDLEQIKMQTQFRAQIEEKFAKEHRKYVLMQQLRHIKRELKLERDDKQSIISAFKEAVAGLVGVPEETQKAMDRELQRMGSLEPSSAEFNISRTYLEWMTSLPWGKTTVDNSDIARAEAILEEDHYGLEDVKERILEHMAVSFLKNSTQGKILCLVGPPGVGKTSVGKSIARALDRKFFRFSVGGLHDVAEIRGHRKTYVGAMPGKVIQALKITQSSNPVILIDEVDKLGRDFRGDPSSALLEVLDPAQNGTFRDLYLDAPVDLSRVLFVCTANVSDTIPEPLLDRMEVIRIAGYVFEEKKMIANQYLIPSTIESHGVSAADMDLQEEAVVKLIRDYAREAGVRELRKLLEKIVRKVALSRMREIEENRQQAAVTLENLTKYVGQPPFSSDSMYPGGAPPGVVMGLAWTAMGGKTLFVEARGQLPAKASKGEESEAEPSKRKRTTPPSGARMKVTGKLGKVMNESSEIALTYARNYLLEVTPPNTFLFEAAMHVNLPEGATPKDGPSAGVTMTSALLSMALDKPVRQNLAMTGELTLSGKVLRVGGIKEKAIAARRENVPTIVLPMSNQADYMEIKPHLRAGLTAHFVDHYDDVYRLAFEHSGAPMPLSSRGSSVVTVFTPEEEADIEAKRAAERFKVFSEKTESSEVPQPPEPPFEAPVESPSPSVSMLAA